MQTRIKIPAPIKLIISIITLTGIIACVGIGVGGCVQPVVGPPSVSSVPGPLITNPPAVPGGSPVIVQLPPITVTNPGSTTYAPNPAINTASNAAAGIAAGASVVPVAAPYAAIASWLIPIIFGGIGAASGYYAQARSTGKSNAMLGAVIQGVESGLTGQAPAIADAVKGAIQSRATSAGVQPALDAVVQKLT